LAQASLGQLKSSLGSYVQQLVIHLLITLDLPCAIAMRTVLFCILLAYVHVSNASEAMQTVLSSEGEAQQLPRSLMRRESSKGKGIVVHTAEYMGNSEIDGFEEQYSSEDSVLDDLSVSSLLENEERSQDSDETLAFQEMLGSEEAVIANTGSDASYDWSSQVPPTGCDARALANCKSFPCIDLVQAPFHHHVMYNTSNRTAVIVGAAWNFSDGRRWTCTCFANCSGVVGIWNCTNPTYNPSSFYRGLVPINSRLSGNWTNSALGNYIIPCAPNVTAKPLPAPVRLVTGLRTSSTCPPNTTQVNASACLAAVQRLLPAGSVQGRSRLVTTSSGTIPGGCSWNTGYDLAAVFNTNASVRNDGNFQVVCEARDDAIAARARAIQAYFRGQKGQNTCPKDMLPINISECNDAVKMSVPLGSFQGRKNLVNGSWNHLPPGCSTQSTGDWAAHFNNKMDGKNNGGYTLVCRTTSTTTRAANFTLPQAVRNITLPGIATNVSRVAQAVPNFTLPRNVSAQFDQALRNLTRLPNVTAALPPLVAQALQNLTRGTPNASAALPPAVAQALRNLTLTPGASAALPPAVAQAIRNLTAAVNVSIATNGAPGAAPVVRPATPVVFDRSTAAAPAPAPAPGPATTKAPVRAASPTVPAVVAGPVAPAAVPIVRNVTPAGQVLPVVAVNAPISAPPRGTIVTNVTKANSNWSAWVNATAPVRQATRDAVVEAVRTQTNKTTCTATFNISAFDGPSSNATSWSVQPTLAACQNLCQSFPTCAVYTWHDASRGLWANRCVNWTARQAEAVGRLAASKWWAPAFGRVSGYCNQAGWNGTQIAGWLSSSRTSNATVNVSIRAHNFSVGVQVPGANLTIRAANGSIIPLSAAAAANLTIRAANGSIIPLKAAVAANLTIIAANGSIIPVPAATRAGVAVSGRVGDVVSTTGAAGAQVAAGATTTAAANATAATAARRLAAAADARSNLPATDEQKAQRANVAFENAVMLMGQLTLVMCILYLLNSSDPNVRKTSWNTLSMTLSIFISILSFLATKSAWLMVGGGSASQKLGASMTFLRYFVAALAGPAIVLKTMQRHNTDVIRVAVGGLVANFISFCAADFFGYLQMLTPFRDDYGTGFGGFFTWYLIIVLLAYVGGYARDQVVQGASAETPEQRSIKEKWATEMEKGENNGVGFVVGLLFSQWVRQSVTGRMPDVWGTPAGQKWEDILELEIWTFTVTPIILAAVFGLTKLHERLVSSASSSAVLRFVVLQKAWLSYSLAWLFLSLAEWEFWWAFSPESFGTGETSNMTAAVMMALFLSAFIFLAIYALELLTRRHPNFTTPIRSFCSGLTIVVGLSWQRVFYIAATYAGAQYDSYEHLVDISFIVAVCVVVTPAWLWYIVPKTVSEEALPQETTPPTEDGSVAAGAAATSSRTRRRGEKAPEASATEGTTSSEPAQESAPPTAKTLGDEEPQF
jgi:hypothetical protein